MTDAQEFCPYRGLQPFGKEDSDYFFGRAQDRERIISNLRVAPLTILYGASGVGKTSVLQAGVVAELEKTARTAVAFFRTWQRPDLLSAVKESILQALPQTGRDSDVLIDRTLAFDDYLVEISRRVRGDVLVIFDQFEEYFLYAPSTEDADGFAAQFARAVNRGDVRANFLISLREDSLSKLDRFKGRIRNVLGNTLRISHLDAVAAEESIRGPLRVYNQKFPSDLGEITIEDGTVHAILSQLRTAKVQLSESAGAGRFEGGDRDDRIETPFLQLVLTELWNAEKKLNSRTLRRETFEDEEKLGGAKAIVRRYVNTALDISPNDQDTCARVFRFLVTPDETKIALPVSVLASWSELPPDRISSVMRKLASGETRIFRIVEPSASSHGEQRYELFHDVLAPAILDWRKLYVQRMEVQRAREEAAEVAAENERRATQAKELEQVQALVREQKLRADLEARSAKRLRYGIIVLSMTSCLLVGALVYAFIKGEQASVASKEAMAANEAAKDKSLLANKNFALAQTYALSAQVLQIEANRRTKEKDNNETNSQPLPPLPSAPPQIKHLIVLMLENRSFDHMLGALKLTDPRVDGLTGNESNPDETGNFVKVQQLAAFQGQLIPDPDSYFAGVDMQIFGGNVGPGRTPNMQGFIKSYSRQQQSPDRAQNVMHYFSLDKLPVLSTLARNFAVCDRWFSSVPGPSSPNHAFADYGTSFGSITNNAFQFNEPYESIYERLVEQGRTAKIYQYDPMSFLPTQVLLAKQHPELFATFKQFLADTRAGNLSDYSFVEPNYSDHLGDAGMELASDQHPDHAVQAGEIFIAKVYNAIHASESLWRSSVLLITYSNHGGIYDHVIPPPTVPDDFVTSAKETGTGQPFEFDRLGVRVPAVIVSPYISRGTVDHTVYDHASIPATVSKFFLKSTQKISPRERRANTFDRVLRLTTPRTDADTVTFNLGP